MDSNLTAAVPMEEDLVPQDETTTYGPYRNRSGSDPGLNAPSFRKSLQAVFEAHHLLEQRLDSLQFHQTTNSDALVKLDAQQQDTIQSANKMVKQLDSVLSILRSQQDQISKDVAAQQSAIKSDLTLSHQTLEQKQRSLEFNQEEMRSDVKHTQDVVEKEFSVQGDRLQRQYENWYSGQNNYSAPDYPMYDWWAEGANKSELFPPPTSTMGGITFQPEPEVIMPTVLPSSTANTVLNLHITDPHPSIPRNISCLKGK